MSNFRIDRRNVLLGASAMAGAAALGGGAAAQAASRVRMYWWGSKERADRTIAGINLFKAQNPSVTVDAETLGWGDYWARMATQAAGRNLPDLIQMDYRYLFEYARRGALLPLDQYVGKGFDIADFGPASTNSGLVDGKLYGINLGNNSSAVIFAKNVYDQAGIAVPTYQTDWKTFAKNAAELTKAAKKDGFYGSADGGGVEPTFEGWLRTRGKELYAEGGKLGFTAEDAGEWYAMWAEMRETKACVPAEIQALDKLSPESSMMTLGKAATIFAHSNQLVAYQAVTPNKLGLSMYPTAGAGSKPAHYLKPSMQWSIAATSKNPEMAVKLANFFLRDPEGAKAIGVERGVPASAATRQQLSGALDELAKTMVEYVAFIGDKVGPLPPPPPKGAGEIAVLLMRVNEQVGFNKLKAAEAGKTFVSEAQSILSRG